MAPKRKTNPQGSSSAGPRGKRPASASSLCSTPNYYLVAPSTSGRSSWTYWKTGDSDNSLVSVDMLEDINLHPDVDSSSDPPSTLTLSDDDFMDLEAVEEEEATNTQQGAHLLMFYLIRVLSEGVISWMPVQVIEYVERDDSAVIIGRGLDEVNHQIEMSELRNVSQSFPLTRLGFTLNIFMGAPCRTNSPGRVKSRLANFEDESSSGEISISALERIGVQQGRGVYPLPSSDATAYVWDEEYVPVCIRLDSIIPELSHRSTFNDQACGGTQSILEPPAMRPAVAPLPTPTISLDPPSGPGVSEHQVNDLLQLWKDPRTGGSTHSMKGQFNPSSSEISMAQKLLNSRHRGKSYHDLVQLQLMHRATVFSPSPAVAIHLFGGNIGDRGMSVAFLAPISGLDRMKVMESFTFRDLSFKVKLPTKPTLTTTRQVVDCLDSLSRFAAEFWIEPLREFTWSLCRFAQEYVQSYERNVTLVLEVFLGFINGIIGDYFSFISLTDISCIDRDSQSYGLSLLSLGTHRYMSLQPLMFLTNHAKKSLSAKSTVSASHDSKTKSTFSKLLDTLPRQGAGKKEVCARFLMGSCGKTAPDGLTCPQDANRVHSKENITREHIEQLKASTGRKN
jgi:hypothetical protein